MTNRRFTNRRTTGSERQERIFDSGPYLARVVSHLDNTFMGSLKVQLIKTTEAGDYRDLETTLITAHYASPFFGQTSVFSNGQNDDFQSSQQSYGFWAVPPDVDSKVLVTFVEGRRDICYWFACVPDDYMNFMVPDGRPATAFTTEGTRPQEGRRYPVGEYNKRITDPAGNAQPTTYPKPVNVDFVNTLTEQGLLEDDFRGLTSSSARREVPSAVFGINTPGPLDRRQNAPVGARGALESKANVPRARLTGHSIVMDDGDDKILRRGSAADSPPEYVELEGTEPGELPEDVTLRPANELFRIRTRTGHQILLHNTEDLIYIANARGTAWIELTSNGKIDIYAQDSISLHTEAEFNVTADSNINLTAGGNINLNATGNIQQTATNIDSTAGGRVAIKASGAISANAGDFFALTSSNDFGITSAAGEVNITGESALELNSAADVNLISDGGAVRVAAGTNFEGVAGTMVAFQAPQVHDSSDFRYINTANLDINSVGTLLTTNLLDILSTNIIIEGTGSIDIKSEGQIICTTDGVIKFKSSVHEIGSDNLSVDNGEFQFRGIGKFVSSLYTSKIWAPQAELNFIRSNSGASGASATTPNYSKHDPGDAAPATAATEAESPAPAVKTIGPAQTVDPQPAATAPRIPQHEPWFEHENLNPQAYARVRAETETTETYVSTFPDTFAHIGRDQTTVTTTTTQTPTPSRTFSEGGDDEDGGSVGVFDYNNYTDNASAIIGFFEGKGFEPWVGAGVAGALQWESGKNINPGAWLPPNSASQGLVNVPGNGGLGARGICQWRNAGNRLTNLERFLGKPLLVQPETNVNAPNYDRLRAERLPTQGYRSMPRDPGNAVRIAPSNTTLEEQLNGMYWEWENAESATLRAIRAINSGSEVQKARQVAAIMNDVFLRSGNPVISGIRVKTRRENSAQEIYEAHVSGRTTAPITDPADFPAPPVVGTGPEAGARPRTDGDPADLTTSSTAPNVFLPGGSARAGALRPEFISALNRAASESGIARIQATSMANEPMRRFNPATRIPIDRWGTLPVRTDGPGADLRYNTANGKWERLIGGQWEARPSGMSWRVGTERHDTGLAVDAYLFVYEGGRLRKLNPESNRSDINRIATFCEAFSRYGGRAVGIGWSNADFMKAGLYHYDMLGGNIAPTSAYIRPRGYTGSAINGWNQSPSTWTYGTPPRDFSSIIGNALAAGVTGGRGLS